jgi:hypothetical protein
VPRPLLKIRIFLAGFILGLILSGVTAFPLVHELSWLAAAMGAGPDAAPEQFGGMLAWIVRVRNALVETNASYPFLAYGTDWLAFAHLLIAAAFVAPFKDPVRHKFILQWGVFCCLSVFALAMIAGPIRGIPLYWRLIDCSFGILGLIPLLLSLHWAKQLERR